MDVVLHYLIQVVFLRPDIYDLAICESLKTLQIVGDA